ncbi:MAG: hypothetical protein ABJD53_04420 [Gammaproteobacteria bacterium]
MDHRLRRLLPSCLPKIGPAAVLTMSLLAAAAADERPQASPLSDLAAITVEAARERSLIEHQVESFVSAIAIAPYQESLARWETSICPLVAGLPRDHGEFILRRISEIAAAAGAPLAAEHCRANFYVIVSADPDALLKAWRKRDPNIFGDEGERKIRGFLCAGGPARVWYNANLAASDGTPLTLDVPGLTAGGLSTGSSSALSGVPNNTHALGFRLKRDEVRELSSVIVTIDSRRARGVSFGQLADYIALAGLAEVRLDAAVGNLPTIFNLFSAGGKDSPPALSAWDQAFLKALYHSDPTDKTQLSAIKGSVVRDVAQ